MEYPTCHSFLMVKGLVQSQGVLLLGGKGEGYFRPFESFFSAENYEMARVLW